MNKIFARLERSERLPLVFLVVSFILLYLLRCIPVEETVISTNSINTNQNHLYLQQPSSTEKYYFEYAWDLFLHEESVRLIKSSTRTVPYIFEVFKSDNCTLDLDHYCLMLAQHYGVECMIFVINPDNPEVISEYYSQK